MIGCLRTDVRTQPIIAHYSESENELMFLITSRPDIPKHFCWKHAYVNTSYKSKVKCLFIIVSPLLKGPAISDLWDNSTCFYKWEFFYQMCLQLEVHIFNGCILIIQTLSIKEWRVLGLHILQSRYHLSILDGDTVLVQHPLKYKTYSWKVHIIEVNIFNVWTIIIQRLNINEWKLLEIHIIKIRHPKCVAAGQTYRTGVLMFYP